MISIYIERKDDKISIEEIRTDARLFIRKKKDWTKLFSNRQWEQIFSLLPLDIIYFLQNCYRYFPYYFEIRDM